MMKRNLRRSRLTALLAAAAFFVTGILTLSFMFTDMAYAAGGDATNYDFKAGPAAADPADPNSVVLPGVYKVQVDMNTGTQPKTIGIPSIAKQNLTKGATKELPAIIMGAAVNYEVRTSPTEFTPISGAKLLPPYSYFRWSIMEEQAKESDGTTTTHKKLSGFDGSYYIVRVDVSKVIADAKAKAGGNLDGKYLHVRQQNNKALLVATGMTDYSFVWSDTSKENNKGGCKAAYYPLANDAKAMKDTSGKDNKTPYLDVILMSSAKNVAGAEAGGAEAPVSNVDLCFYVDDTADYKPWLKALDPNNMPTFPLDVKDSNGNVLGHFETETEYNQALTTKFFDETKATKANSATKYRVMGEDLEIDVAIDASEEQSGTGGDSQGIDWLGQNMDFWSMDQAIAHQNYDDHTIIMICEVPVLNALSISGTKERSVVLDVNSFDIQIANNVEDGKAGLTIADNATLRIMDGSNTAGAELAIGNNATMVIEKGGTMIIDETCTTEAEFDAGTTADSSTNPAHYLSGEITVKEGGMLINMGVLNIEGTEGKPIDSTQPVERDKRAADIVVEYGGLLDNYGCISLKGILYILGNLNNYGRYNDILRAYDPDKNIVDYHRGIQLTWKDDVTQKGIEPGVLNVGIDANGKKEKRAIVNNYGDIVLCPGTINLYGTFNNSHHPDPTSKAVGRLYLCTVNEAIIPFVDPNDPLVVEKRVKIDPPKKSVFNYKNGTFNNKEGVMRNAKVALLHNGVLGALTPLKNKVTKKANPLRAKGRTVTVKYKKLKKKSQTLKVSKVIKITRKGKGKKTYAKVSGNKKLTINKKNGKVTVKKGLKKGTYRLKVRVRAAGDKNYKSVKKTVNIIIKVR